MIRQPHAQEWLANDYCQMKIADYKPYNFVDGEGVRCSLYVSGCLFQCPGCYNKVAQNFNYGQVYDQVLEEKILTDLAAPYCQGLTLLGGEPFLNTPVVLPLCQKVRKTFGQSKDIWAWTGYTWEQLMEESSDKVQLLQQLDVLIDGPFIREKRDLSLRFRGSSNQRIIHVPPSLKTGQIVYYYEEDQPFHSSSTNQKTN